MIILERPTAGALWCRYICLMALLCMIGACSSRLGTHNYQARGETVRNSVAILGVAAKKGLKTTVNVNRIASDLAARLSERGDLVLVPSSQIRQIVGAEPYKNALATYASEGRLSQAQIDALRNLNLRVNRGILLRVESDKVERLPFVRQAVYNEAGLRVVDRERRLYVTRRTTAVSATVLDLRTGRTKWKRVYRISPETKSYSRRYLGSSFSGSVAAEVANSVINGVGGRNHPEPPSLSGNLRALIQEIAYKIPPH